MSYIITTTKQDIQSFAAATRGNKRLLAQTAGLTESVLTGMDEPGWNPKAETLAALARALSDLRRPHKRRSSSRPAA